LKFQNEARTGKSKCVKCLREISTEEFLTHDHLCAVCEVTPEEYPLGSTPHTDQPDKDCFTLPNGECVSESDCMHSPLAPGSGPQASPRPTGRVEMESDDVHD
jgi:hypothetical protein